MATSPYEKLLQQAHLIADRYSEQALLDLIPAPLVILSAPRSGSTLLFETLHKSNGLWSIGAESHFIFNAFPQLHPSQRQFESGALTEADATKEVCHLMRSCFLILAQNHSGQRYFNLPSNCQPRNITLLEKTPRNALNIPFLSKVFPQFRAIFLHRDPCETIASIMEAWEVGRQFVTFPNLPGWDRQNWCLLLPYGWRSMKGKSLAEIATFQWVEANRAILRDLESLGPERWISINYRSLVSEPSKTLRRIAEFADIPFDSALHDMTRASLPLSKTTISAPKENKWRRHAAQIEGLAEQYMPLAKKLAQITPF